MRKEIKEIDTEIEKAKKQKENDKTEIAFKTYQKAEITTKNRTRKHREYFNYEALRNVFNSVKNGYKIDADDVFNKTKIGTINADDNHRDYYLKRALKFVALWDKDIQTISNFNSIENTAIINKHLNTEAIQIVSANTEDGKKRILQIDFKNLYK